MCFNMVAVSNKQVDTNLILAVCRAEMLFNDDGFSYVSKGSLLRTLKGDLFLKDIKRIRSPFVHVHLRKGTQGAISLKNVHLWKIGDYYCSHNGHLNGLGVGVNSDSFEFFNILAKQAIEKEDFKEFINLVCEFTSYGVFILNNSKHAVIVNVGKPLHITYFNKTFIFSNSEIDVTCKVKNFNFELNKTRLRKDALRILDFKEIKFIYEQEIKIKKEAVNIESLYHGGYYYDKI